MAKLSGFAKFEVDIKLTCDSFITLINSICTQESGFSEEKFTELTEVLDKALGEGTTPYAGDLENETYKAVLQAIRDFNASEMASQK